MKWLSIFYKTTYAHFPTSRHGIQRLLHSSAFTIIPVKKVKVSISIPLIGFPSGPAGKESACNAGDLGQSLGWEDPLEKGPAPHSSVLAWRIPWTVWGRQESSTTERLSHTHR